jgi:hypothetical protein
VTHAVLNPFCRGGALGSARDRRGGHILLHDGSIRRNHGPDDPRPADCRRRIVYQFLPSSDVFSLDAGIFGISSIHFANDVIGNVPTSGVNVIVLRTFDNDGNPLTPFGAGNAADLLANNVHLPTLHSQT